MKASLIARGLSGVCAVVLVACGGHAKGASTSRSTTSGATTTSATTSPRPAPAAATAAVRGDWLRFDFNAQRSGVGQIDTEFVGDAHQFIEVVQPSQILWIA